MGPRGMADLTLIRRRWIDCCRVTTYGCPGSAPRTHVPRPTRSWATTALRYLPGLLLLLAVGVIGTFAQTGLRSVATATGTRLPDIEYVLWGLCST